MRWSAIVLLTLCLLFSAFVPQAEADNPLEIRQLLETSPSIPYPADYDFEAPIILDNVDIGSNPSLAPGIGSTWGGMYIGLSGYIPPDPIAASGLTHIVGVVNCEIEWFTKAGVLQYRQGLETFFASQTPLTDTFDPKVIYDQYAGRFVVVSLERTSSPQTSRILIAVSTTGDPNSGWSFQAIDTRLNIGGNYYWADYPGLAVDAQAVYVTANMFPFSSGSMQQRLWIVDKFNPTGGLYGGGTSTVNEEDPSTAVGISPMTTMPTHLFGSCPVPWAHGF